MDDSSSSDSYDYEPMTAAELVGNGSQNARRYEQSMKLNILKRHPSFDALLLHNYRDS
jgi:hypothetical protein